MKNSKNKGFSLAEVMIAIVIISIALAAAVPTITKRNSGSENIWKAGTDADEIAFTGSNVLIGSSRLPLNRNNDTYFDENIDRPNFLPKSDKLVIFKNIPDNESPFAASHISFFNKINNELEYTGRLTADKTNLALGLGALQSIDNSDTARFNTSIGHHSSLTNEKGSYNTTLGHMTLRGRNIHDVENNIAIGFRALQNNRGDNNIAIGSHAGVCLNGNNNIVIGRGSGLLTESQDFSCNPLETSNNNLLITTYAQGNLDRFGLKGFLNLSRGNNAYPTIDNDDNFAIGLITGDGSLFRNDGRENRVFNGFELPLMIQGFTKTKCRNNSCNRDADVVHSKGLIINTDNFNINTSDGNTPIFSVRNGDPITLFGSTTPPCGNAPICLTQFNVRSSTFQTNERGLTVVLTDAHPRFYGPKIDYDGTSTAINTQGISINNAQPNPTYDLYIGSIFGKDKFKTHNNLDAVIEKDESGNIKSRGNSERLIDVGQRKNNNILKYNQISNNYFDAGYDSLNSGYQKHSLQIRTVKTAINFLDEFKENNGILMNLRNNSDDIFKCIFNGGYNSSDLRGSLLNCFSSDKKTESYNEQNIVTKIYCKANPFSILPACTGSDIRLKNVYGDNTAGLKEIDKLKVYNYTYKADSKKTPHVGVMAQDLRKVFPDGVKKGKDGYYRIRHEDMFYGMINSVKELSNKNDKTDDLIMDYIDAPLSKLQEQSKQLEAERKSSK